MIPLPTLLTAYRYGFFPMADASGGVEWYSPDPRGILPIEQFHASRAAPAHAPSGHIRGDRQPRIQRDHRSLRVAGR